MRADCGEAVRIGIAPGSGWVEHTNGYGLLCRCVYESAGQMERSFARSAA